MVWRTIDPATTAAEEAAAKIPQEWGATLDCYTQEVRAHLYSWPVGMSEGWPKLSAVQVHEHDLENITDPHLLKANRGVDQLVAMAAKGEVDYRTLVEGVNVT